MACRADRSFIITGGVGGFGLALAIWLANRGAQNFVLTSKRGLRTGGQRKVIELLRSRGCKVRPLSPFVLMANMLGSLILVARRVTWTCWMLLAIQVLSCAVGGAKTGGGVHAGRGGPG